MIIPHLVDNGWDGIWSAIVSSVAAAATALGIFYVQRRVDRSRGEDEATQVAIEEIRRATLTLVDYIPGDAAQRTPNAERHQDWENAVSLAKPRVHDAKAAQLVSQMQQVAGFYRERWDRVCTDQAQGSKEYTRRAGDSVPREGKTGGTHRGVQPIPY